MKRSRDVILSQILDVCTKSGASKTRIVYQANLNFKMVNPYLDLLIKNGLIMVNEKHVTLYETTLKGKNLLENMQKLHGELSELSTTTP